MAEHEPCIGATSEWYTPPAIFQALGLVFELDPCSPGLGHWVPTQRYFTEEHDGLAQPWSGLVWLNPPFGGRRGQVPWIKKFIAHGDGVGLVASRTSADWWHELMPKVDGILFPEGKTKFIGCEKFASHVVEYWRRKFCGPQELRDRGYLCEHGSPGTGIALIAMGAVGCDALRHSGLGMYWDLKMQRKFTVWKAVAA